MDRLLSCISLATKAGKVASGEFACEKAIKDLKAYLVVLAEDASDNTKKHFTDMCEYRKIRILVYGTKETLGKSCGKDYRSCAAICDKGFGENIIRLSAEV